MRLFSLIALACATVATGAAAEFERVTKKSEFVQLVDGRTLSRPLIKLAVNADGKIDGTGMAKRVSGGWDWHQGYFCRELYWGDEALGYNCQEVTYDGERLRFTSDRGAGDYADFRLR